MEAAESKNHSAELILNALCLAGSDAWCFAPIDGDDLTYCSRSFVRAWGFDPATQDSASCSISLRDPRIGDRLEALGMERDWLTSALRSSSLQTVKLPNRTFIDDVRRVVLPDRGGRPAGILLICSRSPKRSISDDVYSKAIESQARMERLSPREGEILSLVFEGFTNKAVAARAGISEKTVEKHRSNIMRKIGARSVAQLIRRVAEARLIDIDEPLPENSVECS